MKKRCLALILAGLMSLSLIACENSQSAQAPAEEPNSEASAETSAEVVGLANPWRDCTEAEAMQFVVNGFSAPENAVNEKWSVMEKDSAERPGTMVQLTFEMDNASFVAREQVVGDVDVDISGLYYDWTVEDEGTLANWAGGYMPFKSYRFVGTDEYIDLIRWYDIETGYSYSVSAQAKDLEGFDLQAIVEQMYDPAKQESALMPDEDQDDSENKIESLKNIAENAAPSIDISGCDTFTQIVDQKLTSGMGYANATIKDTDVLLVCTGTFQDLDGHENAIDSAVFEYDKDGKIREIGKLCSGGTAYPITAADGYLYSASNHWVCKYAVSDDTLMIMEKASVSYDENGNGTFHYESEDGGDYSTMDSAEAEKIFDKLIDEMMNGEVIEYSVVQ